NLISRVAFPSYRYGKATFSSPGGQVLGLAAVFLGAGQLDQLGVGQSLGEVPATDMECLAGGEGDRLAAVREAVAQLPPRQVAPVRARAHVVGEAAVEGGGVEAGRDPVADEDHAALLDQDLALDLRTNSPHRGGGPRPGRRCRGGSPRPRPRSRPS